MAIIIINKATSVKNVSDWSHQNSSIFFINTYWHSCSQYEEKENSFSNSYALLWCLLSALENNIKFFITPKNPGLNFAGWVDVTKDNL